MSVATLLHLDASARSDRSLSRALSERFVACWTAARPGDAVTRRDLARDPPPHVTEDWIAAAFTSEAARSPAQRAALAPSDTLIAEVRAADVIVVGTPMYNYGLPSTLKAWVDQVIRVDETFTFDLARGAQPIEPVQTGKVLVTLMSSGEGQFGRGEASAAADHVSTQLSAAMRLFGCSHQRVLRIEWQEFGDARHARSVDAAHAAVPALTEEVARLLPRGAA